MSVTITGNNILIENGGNTKTIYGKSIKSVVKDVKGSKPFLVVRTEIDDYILYLKDTTYSHISEFNYAVIGISGSSNQEETLGSGTLESIAYKSDGDIVFQIYSASETTTVTVLNSVDGNEWATAVDENGDDVTGSLVAGTALIIPIYNPRGLQFKLSFAANSGDIDLIIS